MDAAAVNRPKPAASELLLEHCLVLDSHDGRRPDGGRTPRGAAGPRARAAARARALDGALDALARAVFAAKADEEKIAPAETSDMMNAVAWETPTASIPIQSRKKKKTAQATA